MIISIYKKTPSTIALSQLTNWPINHSRPDILIRFGSMKEPRKRPLVELNTIQSIRNASHKYRALKILKQANLPVPPFSIRPDIGFPALWRSFYHTKGRDIVYVPNFTILPEIASNVGYRDYFIELLPKVSEYRYHVFLNEVIYKSVKVGGDRHVLAWNHDNGFEFITAHRGRAERQRICIEAVNALGLDFGAVDFIITPDKEMYILEVNTQPAMSPARLDAYKQAIERFIENERR
jgi:glutathione synthase/RimK-type ligase-like ATP-grasp enzyme